MGDVEGKLKRAGIPIYIVDSLCCTAETNITSQSNYTLIIKIIRVEKYNLFKKNKVKHSLRVLMSRKTGCSDTVSTA